jgi:transposase
LVEADLPPAAIGSPFGPRLHGLALYLKTFQALSFARLSAMFEDVFGLKISQGALVKMLARSHKPFAAQKLAIIERLRRAEMVASDETGIRIEAINSYQWVFLSPDAVVHEARMSRAGQVVRV